MNKKIKNRKNHKTGRRTRENKRFRKLDPELFQEIFVNDTDKMTHEDKKDYFYKWLSEDKKRIYDRWDQEGINGPIDRGRYGKNEDMNRKRKREDTEDMSDDLGSTRIIEKKEENKETKKEEENQKDVKLEEWGSSKVNDGNLRNKREIKDEQKKTEQRETDVQDHWDNGF